MSKSSFNKSFLGQIESETVKTSDNKNFCCEEFSKGQTEVKSMKFRVRI